MATAAILERLERIERQRAVLVQHTAALSRQHTRALASLGPLNATPGLLVGAREIAAFMGLSPSSIWRLGKYGFPLWRMGRHTYTHVLDVVNWMRQQNERHRKAGSRHARH